MQENYTPLFVNDPKNPGIPKAIVELNNLDIPQLKKMVRFATAFLTQKPDRLRTEQYEMMQEVIRLGNQKIPEFEAVVAQEVNRNMP